MSIWIENKEKLLSASIECAPAVQAKLQPPSPFDSINLRYFHTIQIHSIWNIKNSSTFETFPDEIKNRKKKLPPNPNDIGFDFPCVDFSIGYNKHQIQRAIDALDIFESEMLQLEIAEYAETYVRTVMYQKGSQYSSYDQSRAIWMPDHFPSNHEHEDVKKKILETFPVLSQITCFASLVQCIGKELGVKLYASDVVSSRWPGHEWSSRQKAFSTYEIRRQNIVNAMRTIFRRGHNDDPSKQERRMLRDMLMENSDLLKFDDLVEMQKLIDEKMITTENYSKIEGIWKNKFLLRKRSLKNPEEPPKKKVKTSEE